MKELVIEVLVDKDLEVLAIIDKPLDAADCSLKTQMQIEVSG